MKTYKYLLAGACSMFMLSSCLDQYVDLNTNPEVMGTADPVNIFAGATQNYNNCSRGHLTGLYSGTMIYMQYLVSDGGAAAGNYIDPTDQTSSTSPSNLAYSYYYSTFGLRLDNLIKTAIPGQENPEKYNDIKAIVGINMARTAEYYGIPYRTLQKWVSGERKAPDYVIKMLGYAIISELPREI